MSRYLGKYDISRNIDVDESGDSQVAHKCQLFGYIISNTGTGQQALYLKLYNKATAPTVGTDTPVITICVASGDVIFGEFKGGIDFSLGIGVGCTTGVADNNTGAPGANEMIVNLLYK